MFVKSTRFKQVCQLLLSLIVAENEFNYFRIPQEILLYYFIVFSLHQV